MSESTAAMPAQTPDEGGRGGRSTVLVAVVVALVVVLLAGGAFAAWRVFSGTGARPADVLPESTLGVVSLDLDPSGQQKIEAIRTLRKIPSFREEVGLEEDDDLAEAFFDEVYGSDDSCPEVDYDADVAPWLGDRFALAAVALDGEAVPVLVAQVSDVDAAAESAPGLICSDDPESSGGVAVGEDYLVVSETEELAQQVLDAGQEAPLSDDDDYRRMTEAAGGDGIVEAFAAPEAVEYLGDLTDAPAGAEVEELTSQLEDFEGAAATVRFDGGGIALSAAGVLGDQVVGAPVGDYVGDLPADTAAVLGVAVGDESRERLQELAEDPGAGPEGDAIGYVAGALSSLGLDFPDDVITVLGDALSVSLGGQPGSSSLASPGEVPLGVLVHGDVPAIEEVVDKAESGLGVTLESLPAFERSDDDAIAVATQEEYADALLGAGGLGEEEAFQQVVAQPDEAQVILFAQLEEPWLQVIRDNAGDDEVVSNLEVLRAFGLSAWTDEGIGYAEARVVFN